MHWAQNRPAVERRRPETDRALHLEVEMRLEVGMNLKLHEGQIGSVDVIGSGDELETA